MPQVLASSLYDARVNGPYLIMTALEGDNLNKRPWTDIFTEHQAFILKQLAEYTAQLCLHSFNQIGALGRRVSDTGEIVYDIKSRPLSLPQSAMSINGVDLDRIMPVSKVGRVLTRLPTCYIVLSQTYASSADYCADCVEVQYARLADAPNSVYVDEEERNTPGM